MSNTNLGEVRRAAKRIVDDWISSLADDPYNSDTVTPDRVVLADFVNQLLPDSDFGPDGKPLPADPAWMRELYGVRPVANEIYCRPFEPTSFYGQLERIHNGGNSFFWRWMFDGFELAKFSTRHEARQLFTALGLETRKEGV